MIASIRDFTSDDYPACVRITNTVYPDHVETLEDWEYYDCHREPRMAWRRWVAVADGETVGWAQYEQHPWMFHPRKFYFHAQLLPAHRGQGIGSALFDAVVAALREREALMVRSSARESHPEAIRFLGKRGFMEERRGWESELDLTTFDRSTFAGAIEKVERQGIELITFAELASRYPDWKRKLHALEV